MQGLPKPRFNPIITVEATLSEEDESSSESPLVRTSLTLNTRKELKKLLPSTPDNCLQPNISGFGCSEISKEKSFRDVEAIARALNKHFIFTNLRIESRIKVISKMSLVRYDPEQTVFEQGKSGKHFFSIAKGRVEVIVDGKRVNILSTGESFGELALLHDYPRTATIKTLSTVYLWRLDRQVFKDETRMIAIKNYEENKSFIEGIEMFAGLTSQQKSKLLESISEFKFNQGQSIVREGDVGGICYFIKKGKVKCFKKKELIGEISEGKYFGENSLYSGNPRTATITAACEVRCIGLSKENLEMALGNQLEQTILDNFKWRVIEKSSVLKDLDNKIKAKIVETSKVSLIEEKEIIFRAGERIGDAIFMILEGQLSSSEGTWKSTYDCIGDYEVINNEFNFFGFDVSTENQVKLGIITKVEFNAILGVNSQYFTGSEISRVREVSIFKSIDHEKLMQLTQLFELAHFEDREIIVSQNSQGDFFYLIKSGSVSIVKNNEVLRNITKFDYFGERSLLLDEARTASVVANGKVSCWTLKKVDFQRTLDETLLKRIMKRIEMQDNELKFSDLYFVRVLGKGAYGTVFLVTDQKSSKYYALKVLSKAKVEKYNLSNYVFQEIEILKSLDNDFILKLVNNFEDERLIYLLTEFVQGIDLFAALRVLNNLSEDTSRFYFSCLLIIAEYLHDREILYRDFKPENVIVDEEGYPRLIDFGIAKIVNERTFTVLGTPHYIAPEVILGTGYSKYADYWSLGVMLYEFTYNRLPFGADENNPFLVYQSILDKQLNFASTKFVSKDLKSLINQLLLVNPANRAHKIKSSPWLSKVDWESLLYRNVHPPYIPIHDLECKGNLEANLSEIISRELEQLEDCD